jgi:DNA-binding response OmpR family regulator
VGKGVVKMKLLLVDDEPGVQMMVARRLRSEGYVVVTAADGETALELAESEHPDAILLDIMLPKMDGNAVASKLLEKATTRNIPVIFMTCLVNNGEAKAMGYMSGGNHIMGKPIDSVDLLRLVHEVCTSRAA